MTDLPSGTVTFLFTDVEGSTRLWEQHPDAMRAALARHDELIERAIEGRNGSVVKTTGDGFLAAFASAADAVHAAIDAQLALSGEPWPQTGPLRVRMGVHTGTAEIRDGDYHGTVLNRAARLMALGHGGQILVSLVTTGLVSETGVELRDLGLHALRGLVDPEHVFQVVHPQLDSEFGPLRSPESAGVTPPSNLPAPVDRFVGRARELRDVEERLSRTRLLTLLGPGGTGKTRLAVEVASARREDFDDRVYFLDLSAARDADEVLSITARAVGVRDQSDQPLLDAIKAQIGAQRMLLVADNFEQVTAVAPTYVELLRDCPELTLLVTSREALNVTGEQVYPVPPLALPEAADGRSATDLGEIEAVQLFVERARAVRPDFELTEQNAPAVIELCVRLDGLPLAIELATARLALFTPQALVERLGNRLDLLTGGPRDAPARQRALRDTISWSYELLPPDEQRLLALLSVFSSATLEAVEGVARRLTGMETVEVLDGLGSLVHKSLVRQPDDGAAGTRVSMLETIREFAAERLADDPELRDRAVRAHADYFADWAMHQCEKLTGDERDGASARMAADIQNLLGAWRYWVAEQDFEQLQKLTDGLWLLFDARGWYHEAETLVTDLLRVLSSTPSTEERLVQQIVLQTSLARVLMASKGFTDETAAAYERALELCETQGEVPQLLPVLRGLSTYFIYLGKFEKAMRIGEQLLALAERFDDARARVEGHLLVGVSEGLFSRLQPSIEHLEQGIDTYDTMPRTIERFETGNDPGVVCHAVAGMVLWMQGYPDRAVQEGEAAIALALRLHHPHTVAYARFHTGLVRLWRREPDAAREQAAAVIDIGADHDFPVWAAAGACLYAAATAAAGQVEEGIARFDAAMERYRVLKTPPVFWPALLQLQAAILALAGRFDDALACIDEALEVVKLPEPQMMSSEMFVLKGMLLLARGAADHDADTQRDAEVWLERAVERADRLAAPMLQLRAATAMARLWASQGRREPARELLAGAYGRFTEGFTTADLVDAKALLDELESVG